MTETLDDSVPPSSNVGKILNKTTLFHILCIIDWVVAKLDFKRDYKQIMWFISLQLRSSDGLYFDVGPSTAGMDNLSRRWD